MLFKAQKNGTRESTTLTEGEVAPGKLEEEVPKKGAFRSRHSALNMLIKHKMAS